MVKSTMSETACVWVSSRYSRGPLQPRSALAEVYHSEAKIGLRLAIADLGYNGPTVSPDLPFNDRANTRGNHYKLQNHSFHYDLRKHF